MWKPYPMDRKPKCVYTCIRIDEMVHFQHTSGFFFHFKFSVENISYYRNPMQPMDGFWQDQGAWYLSDVSSVIIRMQYSVAKTCNKTTERKWEQKAEWVWFPGLCSSHGKVRVERRERQPVFRCRNGGSMWWRAGRISEYAMPHPSSAKVHPTRDWRESPERLSMGGVSPTKAEDCSNSQVLFV